MTNWLEDSEWLELAQALSQGWVTKVPHDGCSSSECMRIEHGTEGYSAYCFKCQLRGWHPHATNTMKQADLILAHREAKHQQLGATPVPPTDLTQPLDNHKAKAWLLGHGITKQEIDHFGLQYSPSLERVFIPIWCDTKLVNYIGRTMTKTDFKWWAVCRNNMEYFRVTCQRSDSPSTVVLTEDVLSAIKCGRHRDTYALMGTSPSTSLLAMLKDYSTVLVWTDGDAAGDKAWNSVDKYVSRYLPMVTCLRLRTPNDPKCYSNREIKQCLKI